MYEDSLGKAKLSLEIIMPWCLARPTIIVRIFFSDYFPPKQSRSELHEGEELLCLG